MQVSVVVPTYREAENLTELIPRISLALAGGKMVGEIIIVDDDSRDGTVEVCASLREQHNLVLETRKEDRGLATAVLHGMERAQGEVLVVMDADLSHPPERLPEIVRAIQRGADMAVGSRYVAGGETDSQWGFLRWLNSRVATLLARPLTPIADPMAGFFAVHRDTLRRATHLDPIGYKVGLEILVKCGCRIVEEIPIRFRDRVRGDSKLNLRQQWSYLRHLKRLYEYKLEAAVHFYGQASS